FIRDLILAPGNCNDTPGLAAYLDECLATGRDFAGQVWVMDKGDWNRKIARFAQEQLGLTLLARQPERNRQRPTASPLTLDQIRKPIEAVLSVLTECFGIEHILARTEIGIYRRTQAKATAFTLGRYFNRLLDLEPMNLARYAV